MFILLMMVLLMGRQDAVPSQCKFADEVIFV